VVVGTAAVVTTVVGDVQMTERQSGVHSSPVGQDVVVHGVDDAINVHTVQTFCYYPGSGRSPNYNPGSVQP